MTDPGSNPGGGTFLQEAFLVVEQDHLWFGNRNASGRIAQMVEHGSNKPRVGGSSPSVTTLLSAKRSYGVMVSTLDFESSDPGSNPGRTFFCQLFNYSLQAVMLFILQISELKQVEM